MTFNAQTKKLFATAAPIVFFAASVATAITAPNALVVAGGVGLAAAAATAFAATTIKGAGEKIGKLIPSFALAANIPLTINGVLLAAQGLASGNHGVAMAGGLLAVANSVFYGVSNAKGLMNRITPEVHAVQSMCAGLSIAGAGVALKDPALTAIGAGFFTEAAMRYKSHTPVII